MEWISNIVRSETQRLKNKEVVRRIRAKAIIAFLCIAFYNFHIGFYEGCPIWNRLIYCFCHANVFHLIINIWVLFSIRGKIPVFASLFVAFIASTFPMYISEPTMGLSGFLFAYFGIAWGRTFKILDAAKCALPIILFTMLLNGVNGMLHLWCFILGYILSYIYFSCIKV